jgi:hypothetical protein
MYGSSYSDAPSYYGVRTASQPDAPPPVSQSCLSKSYLQDGTVVFADNCTKEIATSGPEGPPPGPPPSRPWRGNGS